MMTLIEAYDKWKKLPGNRTAIQYREGVLKVLMKENADMELVYFTKSFVKGIMRTSSERQELKTQAAAALVSIMEWGAEQNLCPMPNFDYTIASPKSWEEEEKKESEVKPEKKEAAAKPKKKKESVAKPKKEKTTKAEQSKAIKDAGQKVTARLRRKALQDYSDDELYDELIRRGYEGELSKTVVITLKR